MTQEEIKSNFSENLIRLRKAKKLTQAKLAEALCYSDKAISKWEVGAVLPDVEVLSNIADFFGVTVNDLIYTKQQHLEATYSTKHTFITLLSFGLVWFVAAFCYFVLQSLVDIPRLWLIFIASLPASFIVLVVFSSLWFDKLWQAICVSGLVWGLVVFVYLLLANTSFWFIFIVGVVAQILVALWYMFLSSSKYKKM